MPVPRYKVTKEGSKKPLVILNRNSPDRIILITPSEYSIRTGKIGEGALPGYKTNLKGMSASKASSILGWSIDKTQVTINAYIGQGYLEEI